MIDWSDRFSIFQRQNSLDHAFSLSEEYQHSQFNSAYEQKCHKKRPFPSEGFPKSEATSIFLTEAIVNHYT